VFSSVADSSGFLAVPRAGTVLATDDASLPWLVVDASGCLIQPVRAFLVAL
jgi:hypothetical protein